MSRSRDARALTWGEAALAALLVAAISGGVLTLPYDVNEPWRSVAGMLLANPGAAWFRNIHYWSAQGFLVLTAIHAWDTVRRGSERRLRSGPWLRTVLGIPVAGFLMLSGFLLRGDVDASQALRVVTSLLGEIPRVGPPLAGALGLQIVYLQHAAVLTFLVWLIAVEHGRALWPAGRALLAVLVPVAAVSLGLSPSLHDGLDATVQGPWYFVGFQEALRTATHPLVVVAAGAALLGVAGALRWVPRRAAVGAKAALLVALIVYGGLTLGGGAWTTGLTAGWVRHGLEVPAERLRRAPPPLVLGRPEGCLFCHVGMQGLGRSHDPASIGCASCHRGNPFSLDRAVAHRGMTRVPGNLADAARTCGTAPCHASVVPRVQASIMATLSGIVAVDRAVAGAPPSREDPHVERLGHAGADSHLRQLCASCHLGAVKSEPAAITELSRGGGCTACHVRYSPRALEALTRYRRDRGRGVVPPAMHPALTVATGDEHCFGCHSRSGRISLSYAGWHEADVPPAAAARKLEDGRVVYRTTDDAHHAANMQCTDCHTAAEVMGDGVRHLRKAEQLKVRCEDCHARGPLRTVPADGGGAETRKLRALRPGPAPRRPMLAAASGDVLTNTFVGREGRPHLFRKADGAVRPLRPPAAACRDAVHGRLSCVACHSAWAPRCASCHTRFDAAREGFDLLAERAVQGAWIETGGGYTAQPPTLGVTGDVVDPFVPGMVGTMEGAPLRRYARISPHTVTRKGRSCRSCHADPVALGYGEGRLRYERGHWTFSPAHPPAAPDGLPADAWIGFLATRSGPVSTRPDARPLEVAEQRRILAVGACLTCHRDGSRVMRASLRGFPAVLRRASPRCELPRP